MFKFAHWVPLRVVSRYRRQTMSLLSAAKMDPEQLFEEEKLPWYAPDQFYPTHIGEILDSKYKALGKLGYGAHSTSWLCRDIR
jgi:hypothetical protein